MQLELTAEGGRLKGSVAIDLPAAAGLGLPGAAQAVRDRGGDEGPGALSFTDSGGNEWTLSVRRNGRVVQGLVAWRQGGPTSRSPRASRARAACAPGSRLSGEVRLERARRPRGRGRRRRPPAPRRRPRPRRPPPAPAGAGRHLGNLGRRHRGERRRPRPPVRREQGRQGQLGERGRDVLAEGLHRRPHDQRPLLLRGQRRLRRPLRVDRAGPRSTRRATARRCPASPASRATAGSARTATAAARTESRPARRPTERGARVDLAVTRGRRSWRRSRVAHPSGKPGKAGVGHVPMRYSQRGRDRAHTPRMRPLRASPGWLTGIALAAVAAVNLAGLWGIRVARQGALEEARRALLARRRRARDRARGPALRGAVRPRLPRGLAHDRAARRGGEGPVGRVAPAPGRGERAPPLPPQPRRGRPHRGARVRRPAPRARGAAGRGAGAVGLGDSRPARRARRSTRGGRASPPGCPHGEAARPLAGGVTIETEVEPASLLDPGDAGGDTPRRCELHDAQGTAPRPVPAGPARAAPGRASGR